MVTSDDGLAIHHKSWIIGYYDEVVVTSDDGLPDDLTKFGYKINMKVEFKKYLSIFLATYLNHV